MFFLVFVIFFCPSYTSSCAATGNSDPPLTTTTVATVITTTETTETTEVTTEVTTEEPTTTEIVTTTEAKEPEPACKAEALNLVMIDPAAINFAVAEITTVNGVTTYTLTCAGESDQDIALISLNLDGAGAVQDDGSVTIPLDCNAATGQWEMMNVPITDAECIVF